MKKRLTWKCILCIFILGVALYSICPLDKKINLGLDLQGGMHLVLEVDTQKLQEKERHDAVDRTLEVIRNRIDEFGIGEVPIQKGKENRIIIQLPGMKEFDRARDLIKRTAMLEFKLVDEDEERLRKALDGEIEEGYELKYLPDKGETPILLKSEPELTGVFIKDADVVRSERIEHPYPYVSIEFNREGTKRFAEITKKYFVKRDSPLNRRLAIVLDGKVKSAPRINAWITDGKAVIEGDFTIREAKDLAIALRAGSLPCPVNIVENRTVGPTLGQDSINKGILAIIVGTLVVVLFMGIWYKLSGLIANLALFLNLILILGLLAILGKTSETAFTLTLPGIAGIVLTIGICVDANVIIFERIKEELRAGKTIRTGIAAGYRNAFRTILDANVTTLITALILFYCGTGPIRGFAVTLSFGILTSMFTSLFVTRLIFDLITLNRKVTKLSI
ncbi:MAG: protein translocase subunit SecD [bacterium]|nr:protein translocase subunit SecD [bacterium]